MDKKELDLLSAELIEGNAGEKGVDDLIAALKASGRSMVESIYIVSKVFSMSPADAKMSVVTGPSWSKEGEEHEEFHRRLAGERGDEG
ncbi:hypothetical protein ACSDR0_06025 [Streptosporangium sp. G11]|uniref:hypothetical protein n=1 Tax=Streptosporangium sp. G11 TaxID=3436926 RepID=UPI003EBE00DC